MSASSPTTDSRSPWTSQPPERYYHEGAELLLAGAAARWLDAAGEGYPELMR